MPDLSTGLRRIIDAKQRFMRDAPPVFLRLREFADVQLQDWAIYGFAITPTGTVGTGTTDILIDPPASMIEVTMHNIGQSQGKLRFGARHFIVSDTFVTKCAGIQGYTDKTLVWRAPNVVGIVCQNLLGDIVDYWHEEVAGRTVTWGITANMSEIPVTGP